MPGSDHGSEGARKPAQVAAGIALEIVEYSGNSLVCFLDQISFPSIVTSNAPPPDGISLSSLMEFPLSSRSLAARPTARSV